MKKPNIMVAAGPLGRERATRSLSEDYEVQFARTIGEAKRMLSRGDAHYAGIVCGVFFDESRMFELLEFVRSHDGLENLPFVAVHFQRGATALTRASRRAAEILRASVVELQERPIDEGDRLLLAAVQQAMPVKRGRADKS